MQQTRKEKKSDKRMELRAVFFDLETVKRIDAAGFRRRWSRALFCKEAILAFLVREERDSGKGARGNAD